MVGRCCERQYQLTAQKHNETFLKYTNYQQTARYFERACEVARHYDSWNFKNLEFKDQLEKARKAERLHSRRNRLSILLKEDEETYKREFDELQKKRTRTETPISLESLKERLKEKRVEESLYLPKNCRRYQSYYLYPTNLEGSRRTPCTFNSRDSRVRRDSVNVIDKPYQSSARANSAMSSKNNQSPPKPSDRQQGAAKSPSCWDPDDPRKINSKYLTRFDRSLDYTNVRSNDPNLRENVSWQARMDESESSNDREQSEQERNRNESSPSTSHVSENLQDSLEDKRGEESSPQRHSSDKHPEGHSEDRRQDNSKEHKTTEPDEHKVKKNHGYGSRGLDETDEPENVMFPTHRELKEKIQEYAKREHRACMQQSWDDALRFRDVRNRLQLIREKTLYDATSLTLDDDTRKECLAGIDKREGVLAQRENACSDTSLYSEDAKALWKKWAVEDEDSTIKDAHLQREALMRKLEKEWERLAIRDKANVSRSFENIANHSFLQEEHKLTSAVSPAVRKSFPTLPIRYQRLFDE